MCVFCWGIFCGSVSWVDVFARLQAILAHQIVRMASYPISGEIMRLKEDFDGRMHIVSLGFCWVLFFCLADTVMWYWLLFYVLG